MDKLCMTLGWLTGRRIAGQRTPAEPWELLFEGDVTTETSEYGNYTYLDGKRIIQPDDNPPETERLYRLTVDGVPIIQVLGIAEKGHGAYTTYYVGNMALFINSYNSNDALDNGEDFCVFDTDPGAISYYTYFCSRNTGTYHIKVERLLKDPVAYSYNGVRLPTIPEDGGSVILMSDSGAARLLKFTGSDSPRLGYSVEQEAFVAQRGAYTVECRVFDPAQGQAGWARRTNLDAVLETGESYPMPGESLLWAKNNISWWHNPESTYSSKDTILEGSRAMPIFDYKEW